MELPVKMTPAPIDSVLAQALEFYQAGRLPEARKLYRKILAFLPDHADGLHLSGLVDHAQGLNLQAVRSIGRAIAVLDLNPVYYNNLGAIFLAQGLYAASAKHYAAAVLTAPHDAAAYGGLGNALRKAAALAQSISASQRAIKLEPQFAEFHAGKAHALEGSGRTSEALATYRGTLSLSPAHPDAWNNMGIMLKRVNVRSAAIACGHAVHIQPAHPDYRSNLGHALHGLGALRAAVTSYKTSIALKPNEAIAHSNLANTYQSMGRNEDAIGSCVTAIKINPTYSEAHDNLGNAAKGLPALNQATTAYRAAIATNPAHANAYNNLGNLLKDQARISEAISLYKNALKVKPDASEYFGNLAMTSSYAENSDESLNRLIHSFSQNLKFNAKSQTYIGPQNPAKRLRIGYVSGDFISHPVASFFTGVLSNHDPAVVETFCYSNISASDDTTDQLRARSDHWRDVAVLSDSAAAARIASDDIDILIDLSGHTARNRLELFALKPAPVQATWLGYWNTTGVPQMDYLITDATTVPQGSEHSYSEKILRLPNGRFCYTPPPYAPSPERAALSINTPVTFGSFNNLAKVGEQSIALWAEVLREIPQSRLLLKWKTLADESERQRITEHFSRFGIREHRLILRGPSPHPTMLSQYGEMDVALDTHPFSGGLTTCEALWMGVPVVTLFGSAPQSRQTLSFLHDLGLTTWGAATPEDYVRVAKSLARRRSTAERLELRQRMAASPLCDGPLFTRNLELLYRQMWECVARPSI